MKPLPFTAKSEYLTWRTHWRSDYAKLSTQIREAKKNRKGKAKPLTPSAQTCYCSSSEQSLAQCQCWVLRKKATAMLEIRAQSKEQAQQLYLATKAAAVQAPTPS